MAAHSSPSHSGTPDAPSLGTGRLRAGKTRRVGAKDDRSKTNKQLNLRAKQGDIAWLKAALSEHGGVAGLAEFAFSLMREGLEARTQPARVQITEKAASAGDLARAEEAIQERLARLDEALTVALQQNRHLHEAVKESSGHVEALTNQVGLNTRTLLEMRPALGRAADSAASRYPKKTTYGEG
jgi:hypothetical protein